MSSEYRDTVNKTERIGGKGTGRKMKIFKETNADLNIHFTEL